MVAYRWKEEKFLITTDSTMNWGLESTQHYCSPNQKQQYSTKPCQSLDFIYSFTYSTNISAYSAGRYWSIMENTSGLIPMPLHYKNIITCQIPYQIQPNDNPL